MDDAERREYARRVVSNPTDHYIEEPHRDVKLEWIERTIGERIIEDMKEESYTMGGLIK